MAQLGARLNGICSVASPYGFLPAPASSLPRALIPYETQRSPASSYQRVSEWVSPEHLPQQLVELRHRLTLAAEVGVHVNAHGRGQLAVAKDALDDLGRHP